MSLVNDQYELPHYFTSIINIQVLLSKLGGDHKRYVLEGTVYQHLQWAIHMIVIKAPD